MQYQSFRNRVGNSCLSYLNSINLYTKNRLYLSLSMWFHIVHTLRQLRLSALQKPAANEFILKSSGWMATPVISLL